VSFIGYIACDGDYFRLGLKRTLNTRKGGGSSRVDDQRPTPFREGLREGAPQAARCAGENRHAHEKSRETRFTAATMTVPDLMCCLLPDTPPCPASRLSRRSGN
jgi:hypothetical protein